MRLQQFVSELKTTSPLMKHDWSLPSAILAPAFYCSSKKNCGCYHRQIPTRCCLKLKIKPVAADDGRIIFIGAGKKTVNVQQIRERFEALDISVEWKRFTELVNLRNNLEHYYTAASPAVVQEALSKAFVVLHSFVTVQLKREPLELFDTTTWHTLLDVSTVYESQLKACQSDLSSIDWPSVIYDRLEADIRCTHCYSELIKPIDPDVNDLIELEFLCTACGQTAEFEEVIEAAISEAFAGEAYIAMTDGGELPIVQCHECGREAFHLESDNCLVCGATRQYTECILCGEVLGPDDQDNGGLCGYHKWQADKDD